MKKIIALCLGVLLSLASLCACAVQAGGDSSDRNSGSYSAEIPDSDNGNSEEDDADNVLNETSYTVTLSLDDKQFIPSGTATYVQWTRITETGDITGFKTATFNENGVAFANGLDGEYRVTLGNLPDGYSYNPNLYVASGNSRNIVVELYPIIKTTAKGTDFYDDVITIHRLGVYRVTISKLYGVQKGVYFQFSIPKDGGVYSVQSMADVMENTVNPIAEIYHGSGEYKNWSHTCDDGVAFENGSYTKNFYFEGQASEDQGGFGIIPFAVRATTNNGKFPVTVDFLVSRKADYPSTHQEAEMIKAKQLPKEKAPEGNGTWVYAETYKNGQYIFDGANYVYNEEDGFYHVGTKDGPYLYVTLDVPDRFIPPYTPPGGSPIPLSLTAIDGVAPTAYLRIAELDKNTGERTGRLINYKDMIEKEYKFVCNSDGRCLVTKEMQWFLQELCESNAYFNDGYGWVETESLKVCGYSISAAEDDQWLFACGYYKS